MAAMNEHVQAGGLPAQRELHRRLLLIDVEVGDKSQWLVSALQAMAGQRLLWIGDEVAGLSCLAVDKAHHLLGSELDLLVFDARKGFDQDAFAAVSGTVRGGGLLVLLTPPLHSWTAQPDPACERFVTHPHQLSDVGAHFLQRLLHLIEIEGDEPQQIDFPE